MVRWLGVVGVGRVTGLLEGPGRADVRQERFASLRDRNKFRLLTHTSTTREGRSYPGAAEKTGNTGPVEIAGVWVSWRLDRHPLGGCGPDAGLQPPIGSITRAWTRSGDPIPGCSTDTPLQAVIDRRTGYQAPEHPDPSRFGEDYPSKPHRNPPQTARQTLPPASCVGRGGSHPNPHRDPPQARAPPSPTTPTPNKTVLAHNSPRDPHSCALPGRVGGSQESRELARSRRDAEGALYSHQLD